MELAQLAIFRAIADAGTVQGAAQLLNRVPSNVTTRLRQLEEELGVELFIRERMRLRLSATGIGFLNYARKILELTEEARASVGGDQPHGLLALGALESVMAVRLPSVLAAYHRLWPEVELDLSTGPSGAMIERVLAGTLAGAFVDGPLLHPLLRGTPLFDEELVVISAHGRLPIKRASDVNGSKLFAFRPNCSYRRIFERWFEEDGAVPGPISELESYHGMVACVSVGAGLGLLPYSMLQSLPNKDSVTVHHIESCLNGVRIYLIRRADLRSPALSALEAMVLEAASAASGRRAR